MHEQTVRGAGLNDSKSRLKLGVFCLNASGGGNASTLPRHYELSWEHSSAIALRAESLGFEFVLPIAKWRGFGGETDYWGESYETLTWAAAMAAQTSTITVAATTHIPVIHPTFVAKAGATIDHISRGRFALNVVMGWFPLEIGQFGIEPAEHDIRYEHGSEWLTVLKRLWREHEPFDFNGRWIKIGKGLSKPKPLSQPPIINAGTSSAGIDFAARHCDLLLASRNTLEGTKAFVDRVQGIARDRFGRKLGVLNTAQVICAPTEAEARSRQQQILEAADTVGVTNFMEVLGIKSESFNDTLQNHRELIVSAGGGFPLVGTPQQIVDKMAALADAGIEGLALIFYDFYDELQVFGREIMPLMRKAGLHV